MENGKKVIENAIRESTKILGSDIHPVPLEERLNATPVNDVEWSGLRGQSFCVPTSKEVRSLLKKYGEKGIPYSLKGEPDFSKVSIAKVKIPDMTSDMGHDYTSTIHKLLDTDFAKENGINTSTQMREYMKEHDLTIHEGSDGVTEYLVDRKIHQTFRHYGGRGKLRNFENVESERIIPSKISETAVNVNKSLVRGDEALQSTISDTNEKITNAMEQIRNSDFAAINSNSIKAAVGAMSVATITTIVDNAVQTARGEKTKEEAITDSAKTIAETGITRYTQKTISQITEKVINKTLQDGALKQVSNKAGNDVAVVMVKTGQQFVKYCRDEITLDEMIEDTSEIITEQIIQFTGGLVFSLLPIPGSEFIGRYVATVLYHSVKQIQMDQKQMDRYLSFMQSLSRETTKEIDRYRDEFALYTKEYNSKAVHQMNQAFQLLDQGMLEDDISKASQAIEMLANMVGETVSDITEEKVFGEYWVGN